MNSGFLRPVVEALEIVISALLEFVGIEVGKYFLGEFFIALLVVMQKKATQQALQASERTELQSRVY